MQTHEQFIELSTARLAKQAGFDWEVRDFFSLYEKTNKYEIVSTDYAENYNESVYATYSAPTQAVLQRWLREEKDYHLKIEYVPKQQNKDRYYFVYYTKYNEYDVEILGGILDDGNKNLHFLSFEEALEAGLQKCLTLLIENKL